MARVLSGMGRSILALGNEAEAGRVWREALRLATNIHGTPVVLEALTGFASLEVKRGELEHALELLLAVLNHPASFQVTRNRAADLRADLEAQLTRQQVEIAQTRVRMQSFDQVVSQALEQIS